MLTGLEAVKTARPSLEAIARERGKIVVREAEMVWMPERSRQKEADVSEQAPVRLAAAWKLTVETESDFSEVLYVDAITGELLEGPQ